MAFKLKQNMLLGAASAATQIEGGDLNHSWNFWYKQGKIKDGSNPARANDHYNLWKQDFDLMKQMGIQVYRFGIEWARIEPSDGSFDKEALDHYREMLLYLKKLGIKPLLTLHHFTNPMWFEEQGGFTEEANIAVFLRFVRKVIYALGDLASEYITINEPNVYAYWSYFYGTWPPAEKSLLKTAKVMSVMCACHIKAYEMIHKMRKEMGFSDTKVGFANHLRVFEPKDSENLYHIAAAKTMEHAFQGAISEAMLVGKFSPPIVNYARAKRGVYSDFLGINYYSRSTVSGISDGVKENVPVNDLGWEIYPKGIVRTAEKLYKVLKRPIYITENGTCDNADTFRAKYIYSHIKELCKSNLPFERYYHWCFCDNFEWLEGESARFGLVHVDYETQTRTIKQSGHFYSEMIKESGVSNELYERFVKNCDR